MASADQASAQQRASRGVRFIGCDFRIGGFSFPVKADGELDRNNGQLTLELRTDTWRFWLREAIDAAIAAADVADQIPPLYEKFEAGNATEEDLDELAIRELIASMRAITASAFAIDAFYATVKARSPRHPDQDVWTAKKTARYKQVAETIIYHLRIGKQSVRREIRVRVRNIFKARDLAVHPGSEFRDAVYRPDLNVGLDQIFTTFRRQEAVMATAMAVSMFDYFVSFMDNGSEELAKQKAGAREKMDAILDSYEAAGIFPAVERREPPPDA